MKDHVYKLTVILPFAKKAMGYFSVFFTAFLLYFSSTTDVSAHLIGITPGTCDSPSSALASGPLCPIGWCDSVLDPATGTFCQRYDSGCTPVCNHIHTCISDTSYVNPCPVPPPPLPNVAKNDCRVNSDGSQRTGLTNKIVGCITDILLGVVDDNFGSIRTGAKKFVEVLIVLYIIFFAIQAFLGNLKNAGAEIVVHVLTISLVYTFTQTVTLEDYIKTFMSVTQELVTIVMDGMPDSAACTRSDSMKAWNTANPTEKPLRYNVWQQLDCTVAYIMGARPLVAVKAKGAGGDTSKLPTGGVTTFADMAVDPYRPHDPNYSANGLFNVLKPYGVHFVLFGVVIGLLFTPIGIPLLIIALAVPILMVTAFAQAVLIYIMSLMSIVFLGLIGPIIIPMALFPATRMLFDYWLRMLLANVFQPMVILGGLALVVNVIGVVVKGHDPCTFVPPTPPVLGSPGTPGSTYNDTIGCGLAGQLDIASKTPTTKDCLINFGNKTGFAGGSAGTCITQTSTGINSSNVRVTKFAFWPNDSASNKKEIQKFLMHLLVIATLLAMMSAFVKNLMTYGAKVAGINAGPETQATQVFNRVVKKMSDKMNQK